MPEAAFLQMDRRQAIRGPINPLDKSTIISIFPKPVEQFYSTIQPGLFKIDAGSFEKPSILVVGQSSWWKDVGPEEPLLEIPCSSLQVSDSICRDYLVGIYGCDMSNKVPGLFWVPGALNLAEIKSRHMNLLEAAKVKQDNWYKFLVESADVHWARTNGNPLGITDDMRLAAKELNLNHVKEWTRDVVSMEMVRCIACGHFKNPQYPICSNCKAISDPTKAKELGLVFAK